MQWLILYAHQNDDVLNEWHNYSAENKNVELLVDQVEQIQKNKLILHKIGHTK